MKQIIERGDKVIAAGRSYESMSALRDIGAILALWDVSAPLEHLQRTGQGLVLLVFKRRSFVDAVLLRSYRPIWAH